MTTEVLLIRHGSHDRLGHVLCGRMPGVRLNQAGRTEAEAIAAWIGDRARIDALIASPLERAVETAAPLATRFGLKPEIDDDMSELDFGDWSACSFDALRDQPVWHDWNLNRDHVRPPGGETFAEAQTRIVRSLGRLHRRFPEGRVAVVSHADLIKAALAWALGLPLAFYGRFEVSPASISRIAIDPHGAKVVGINRTADS